VTYIDSIVEMTLMGSSFRLARDAARVRAESREPRVESPEPDAREAFVATDPVCKMQVDEKTAAGKSEYQGRTYYFCSTSCKTRFDKEPEKFSR
jgi:YHS domain-containing protein